MLGRALSFSRWLVSPQQVVRSARFDSSSYNADRPAPPHNVASAMPAPQAPSRVDAQPLPAPNQPAPGAYGTRYPASYQPGGQYSGDITGSVARAPAASGHWAWNGGSAVTVGYGETIDTIARKHNVPASALMQTNGIRDASQIRPGQRLVIPHYVSNAPQTAAARVPAPAAAGNVHVVQSGETLMSIARRNGVTLAALASANHVQSTAKLSIGDRLTIPAGGHPAVATAHPAPAPQVAQPRTVPATKVASAAPVQSAHVAKEEPHATDTVVKPLSQMAPCRPSVGRFVAA